MKKTVLLFIALIAGVQFGFAQVVWNLDKSHSSINFAVTHMVITETAGKFQNFSLKVTSKDDSFEEAKIEFTADVKSINTEDPKRDGHLQAPDFFDAAKFPQVSFKSTSFKKVDDKNFKLIGVLTIKGISKNVELNVKYNGTVTDPWGNTRAGFKATGSINRSEFGLGDKSALSSGGLIVGEEVTLTLPIELIKQK